MNSKIINKYYLYCHTCNGRPFYIGIGSKSNSDTDYHRAYEFRRRNRIWNEFFNNCKEFEVHIFNEEETNDRELIYIREKVWISEFGRWIKEKDGLLANISAGGDNFREGKLQVIEYDLEGKLVKIWTDQSIAALEKGCTPDAIRRSFKPNSSCRGSQWRRWKKDFENNIGPFIDKSLKPVNQCDLDGNTLKSYKSIREASKLLGIHEGSISSCAKNKRKSAGGFIWEYSQVGKALDCKSNSVGSIPITLSLN